MAIERFSYDDAIVRKFMLMILVWVLVGTAVGLVEAFWIYTIVSRPASVARAVAAREQSSTRTPPAPGEDQHCRDE